MKWLIWLKRIAQILSFGAVFLFALGPATMPLGDTKEQIRSYTRAEEFDYIEWTIDAINEKLRHATLDTASYLDLETQKQIVLEYIDLIFQIKMAEAELSLVYTDPEISDPESPAEPIRERLTGFYAHRDDIAPLAESIIQQMIAETVTKLGFTVAGQPVPPVMYHNTPLPWALIVSPRDEIRQVANISLETELTIEGHILIEDQISEDMGYSTLVVPVGGVGTYPTMVAETTNLNWLMEVVSHEWSHNYLTLRPLGVRYDLSPELRTINETTANIFGKEVGAELIRTYFPESAPAPPAPVTESDTAEQPAPEPEVYTFDYRYEMYVTRVRVDELLARGEIDLAETFMEYRRGVFWENGYRIRKLNQAYFAFHGAYADSPVSSAGEDPVGAAVRQLRAQSDSLSDFVDAVSKVTSFTELQGLIE